MGKKEKSILYNIKVYNKIYNKYEKEHGDIYNPIEQKRLRESLARAMKEIQTKSEKIKCLDFGCGAGNVTKHLLEIALEVHVADVSVKFLDLVESRFNRVFPGKVSTVLLNGKDLSNINDNVYDFIAAYSVLHHVPDYLTIIKEFCRILKPGGVLYIDHELSPSYWIPTKECSEYSRHLKRSVSEKNKWKRFLHLFIPKYWLYKIKHIANPKFRTEGDIHIFPDDHIEWAEIKKMLFKKNTAVIYRDDYLLCRRHCPVDLYEKYKDICNDVRCLVARKKIQENDSF